MSNEQGNQNLNQIPGQESERSNYNRRLEFVKILAWIAVVCLIGFFALNQFAQFKYHSKFILKPCGLCADLNPEVKECIDFLNSPQPSFPLKDGVWTDPFNKTIYNVTIKK